MLLLSVSSTFSAATAAETLRLWEDKDEGLRLPGKLPPDDVWGGAREEEQTGCS